MAPQIEEYWLNDCGCEFYVQDGTECEPTALCTKAEEVPPEVEYVFSLMNFDGNENKVTLDEFLKSAGHYRKLRQLLSIQLLDEHRTDIIRRIKENKMSSSTTETWKEHKNKWNANIFP